MNNFKRITLLGASALLTCFAACNTQAQFFGGIAGSQAVYPFASTNWNSTNSVVSGPWNTQFTLPPDTSTNGTFPLVDCNNARNISLQISANGITNTATITISIVRSTDGMLWDTSPFVLLSTTAAAGVNGTISTNFDMGGFRYWTALGWTNSAGVSNAVVHYGIKPGF